MNCLDPDATAAHIEHARDLRARATRAVLTAPLRALAAFGRPCRRPPTEADLAARWRCRMDRPAGSSEG
jgi:hypothetical protein